MSGSNVASLSSALQIIDGADRANSGVYLDIWHIVRGEVPFREIAALPVERIIGVELNDGSLQKQGDCLRGHSLPPSILRGGRVRYCRVPASGAGDRLPGALRRGGSFGPGSRDAAGAGCANCLPEHLAAARRRMSGHYIVLDDGESSFGVRAVQPS